MSQLGSQIEWIIIDQIQKMPKLFDTVHQEIERHSRKFALTGSSARKLKAGGANLPSRERVRRRIGRVEVLHWQEGLKEIFWSSVLRPPKKSESEKPVLIFCHTCLIIVGCTVKIAF